MICLVDCTESLDCPHTCKRVSFSKLNIVVRTLSVGTCSERSYRLPAHLQSFCATVLFRRSEFTVADRNMYLIYSSNTAFGWSKVTGTHQMCTVHRHGGAVRKNAIGHNHLHARCLRGDTVCADFAPDRWTHFPVRLTRCINNLPLLQGRVFVDRHAFLPDAHGRSNIPCREGCVSRQLSLQGYTRCIYGVPYRDGCVCIALSVRAHTVHIILWRTLQGGLCVHSHPSL